MSVFLKILLSIFVFSLLLEGACEKYNAQQGTLDGDADTDSDGDADGDGDGDAGNRTRW